MSEVKGLSRTLPPKEIPFQFECTGAITSRDYKGSFTVKVPSVREMSQIGLELSRINQGIPLESLDVNTARLNNAIAFLTVTLTQAPDWFTSEDDVDYGFGTLDVNLITTLFRQASGLVDDWHKTVRGEKVVKSKGKVKTA